MIQFGQNTAVATIAPAPTGGLLRYDAACKAVAEANSIDEVKDFRDQAEAVRAYAKQAKNKQLEIDASEIRFRAERRLGELMAMQSGSVGLAKGGEQYKTTGSKSDPVIAAERLPTLAENGIDKHLADRARKYAAVPEKEFEAILADRRDRIETENKRVTVNLIEAGVRGTTGTGENEWYTPDEHIELARKALGSIDLDPASSHVANRAVKAERFFSAETNGLEQEWAGNVWLNPPYAQPEISYFADKLVAEWESERLTAAIALTHNYTDTAWFQKLARSAAAICFTRGRVKFVSPSGEVAAPTQGQAFFYFGTEVDIFADVFGEVGFVVVRHGLEA
jgi:phage N-6-adenine-methyltransferase